MYLKLAVVGVTALSLTACQTVQNNPNTALGAGLGAAAGAGLGLLVGGNDRRNALVGAGVGLLAGAAVGSYLDQQQRALEQDLSGTGATVTRIGDSLLVNLPGGVTFDTDSSAIKPQFFTPLSNVAQTMNEYPESYIDVVGHTDNVGSAAYNQSLSERRARSVGDFLVSQRVVPERIVTYGQGFNQPVASNATPEGRAANRRVEIKITPATRS